MNTNKKNANAAEHRLKYPYLSSLSRKVHVNILLKDSAKCSIHQVIILQSTDHIDIFVAFYDDRLTVLIRILVIFR